MNSPRINQPVTMSYQLVPAEPTEAMGKAGAQYAECGLPANAVFAYRAMLNAAPPAPAEAGTNWRHDIVQECRGILSKPNGHDETSARTLAQWIMAKLNVSPPACPDSQGVVIAADDVVEDALTGDLVVLPKNQASIYHELMALNQSLGNPLLSDAANLIKAQRRELFVLGGRTSSAEPCTTKVCQAAERDGIRCADKTECSGVDAVTIGNQITAEFNLREIIARLVLEHEGDGVTQATLDSAHSALYKPFSVALRAEQPKHGAS